MKKFALILLISSLVVSGCQSSKEEKTTACCEGGEWVSLFDGKTLDGWKASETEGTFSVQDGKIVVHGKRSHLYYVGAVNNANFKNFEFKADVMTEPGSNSGIYFHTEFQQDGWPGKGYETQINNSHSDWKRTSSIYDVVNVKEAAAKDNEWFTQHIIVKGKHVIVKTNDKVIVDYTEPEEVGRDEGTGRKISSGTFCLQGHDPKSVVYYKNIKVKALPCGE